MNLKSSISPRQAELAEVCSEDLSPQNARTEVLTANLNAGANLLHQ
jgi:hypothetical protein